MAQVVAGALAAVTSMLLSSQIGITGSVIGVAVGSVVSTVSSQLYKKFVQKGVDKVKDIASTDVAGPNGTAVMAPAGVSGTSDGGTAEGGASQLTNPRLRFSASHDQQVMKEAVQAQRAQTGTTVVMPRLEDKLQARKAARLKRNVIIVSVATALVAMLVSAFVVNVVTAGNGIGYKTQPIIATSSHEADDADGRAAAGDGAHAAGQDALDGAAQDAGDGSNAAQSAGQGSGTSTGNAGSSGAGGNADAAGGSGSGSANAGGDGSSDSTASDTAASQPGASGSGGQDTSAGGAAGAAQR